MQATSSSVEDLRLAALARYAVVDTLPEAAFDRLAELVTEFFCAPIALISLVDQEHQFFKACLGMDIRSTDRSLSFCAHALDSDDIMVVADATLDPRFQNNALVTGTPHIRFYAGAPLVTPDGYRLGTLCIIDDHPRPGLSEREQRMLRHLAAIAIDELELRVRNLELERQMEANQQLTRTLQDSRRFSEALLGVSELMLLDLPFAEVAVRALQLISEVIQVDCGQLSVVQQNQAEEFISFTPASFHPLHPAALVQTVRQQNQHRGPVFGDTRMELPDAAPGLTTTSRECSAWLPLGQIGQATYGALFWRDSLDAPWTVNEQALLRTGSNYLKAALQERHHRWELEQAVLTDPVTGLPNQQALQNAFDTVHDQRKVALTVLELRGEKAVTNHERQAWAEMQVQEFSGALRQELQAGRQLYRLGQERFALLTEQGTSDEISSWAEEMLISVDKALAIHHLSGIERLEVWIGTALGSEGVSLQAVLSQAYRRMSTSRHSGLTSRGGHVPAATTAGPLEDRFLLKQAALDPVWQVGLLRVRPASGVMEYHGRAVSLSRKEAQLMTALSRQPGKPVPRHELIHQIWQNPSSDHTASLSVYISRVRKKLAELTPTVTLTSVPREGYALNAGHGSESRTG